MLMLLLLLLPLLLLRPLLLLLPLGTTTDFCDRRAKSPPQNSPALEGRPKAPLSRKGAKALLSLRYREGVLSLRYCEAPILVRLDNGPVVSLQRAAGPADDACVVGPPRAVPLETGPRSSTS